MGCRIHGMLNQWDAESFGLTRELIRFSLLTIIGSKKFTVEKLRDSRTRNPLIWPSHNCKVLEDKIY